MTVYNTAYDTTACNNFRTAKIVDAIQEAMIRDYIEQVDGVAYVENSDSASGQVPAFKHALYISKHHSEEIRGSNEMKIKAFLAMDARAAGRFDVSSGQFKVTNSTMYRGLVTRAALTSVWLSNGANAFRSITPTAMSIFASWVAETISFRYNLDPKSKMDLMVVAAIFYVSNHTEGVEFDKTNEARLLASIAGAIKITTMAEVSRIYDITKAIGSVDDFCTKTRLVLNNVRLEEFNSGVLIHLVGSTWGGDNRVELMGVALEHPPTWISVLYEAITNKAMRNVGLSKICERRQYVEGLGMLTQVVRSAAPDSYAFVNGRLGTTS